MDIDGIELGIDFSQRVQSAIQGSDVVLVVIGREWATLRDDTGSARICQPGDHVAKEIETAISLDKPIIPVLLDGAQMPSASALPVSIRDLSTRNGISISHASFSADVGRLAQGISRLMDTVASRPAKPKKKKVALGASPRPPALAPLPTPDPVPLVAAPATSKPVEPVEHPPKAPGRQATDWIGGILGTAVFVGPGFLIYLAVHFFWEGAIAMWASMAMASLSMVVGVDFFRSQDGDKANLPAGLTLCLGAVGLLFLSFSLDHWSVSQFLGKG